MFILKFQALGGAITLEQQFEKFNDAVILAFSLEDGRPDCKWTIEPMEVSNVH